MGWGRAPTPGQTVTRAHPASERAGAVLVVGLQNTRSDASHHLHAPSLGPGWVTCPSAHSEWGQSKRHPTSAWLRSLPHFPLHRPASPPAVQPSVLSSSAQPRPGEKVLSLRHLTPLSARYITVEWNDEQQIWNNQLDLERLLEVWKGLCAGGLTGDQREGTTFSAPNASWSQEFPLTLIVGKVKSELKLVLTKFY